MNPLSAHAGEARTSSAPGDDAPPNFNLTGQLEAALGIYDFPGIQSEAQCRRDLKIAKATLIGDAGSAGTSVAALAATAAYGRELYQSMNASQEALTELKEAFAQAPRPLDPNRLNQQLSRIKRILESEEVNSAHLQNRLRIFKSKYGDTSGGAKLVKQTETYLQYARGEQELAKDVEPLQETIKFLKFQGGDTKGVSIREEKLSSLRKEIQQMKSLSKMEKETLRSELESSMGRVAEARGAGASRLLTRGTEILSRAANGLMIAAVVSPFIVRYLSSRLNLTPTDEEAFTGSPEAVCRKAVESRVYGNRLSRKFKVLRAYSDARKGRMPMVAISNRTESRKAGALPEAKSADPIGILRIEAPAAL
jgi:hypothetical protein